jgi:hypothetical protein
VARLALRHTELSKGLFGRGPQKLGAPATSFALIDPSDYFFASLKTLLIPTKAKCLTPESTSRASFSLAGFQVTLIGRFWVTPEGGCRLFSLSCLQRGCCFAWGSILLTKKQAFLS